jgi:hypothetical protein
MYNFSQKEASFLSLEYMEYTWSSMSFHFMFFPESGM